MAWLAKVPTPRAPLAQIHVALYGYFPQAPHGERPYVWRIVDQGRSIVMLSSMRPTTACVEIAPQVGRSYAFDLTFKRVRNVRGGEMVVEMTSMMELRQWLVAWASTRGAQIGFVRLDKLGEVKLLKGDKRIRIPLAFAGGNVLITDAALFDKVLTGGGPGTGKAYGCGMWWLPELMEPALASLAKEAA